MAQPFLAGLAADPECEAIVGIDLRPPANPNSKLTFRTMDIRDPRLAEAMRGCDTVVDFAFVVQEIRDKEKTHDININGSRNVFECAARAGVTKIVYISSIAAYGLHPDNPQPLTEDCPLRGNTRDEWYYSYGKREVELYLDRFAREHPGIVVTRIRPAIVVGPMGNSMLEMFARLPWLPVPVGVDHPLPFVHEEDMAQAIHRATRGRYPGGFNIVAESITLRQALRMAGVTPVPLPWRLVCWIDDVLYTLGVPGVAGSGNTLIVLRYPFDASGKKAREVLGWKPCCRVDEGLRAYVDARKRGPAQAMGKPPADLAATRVDASLPPHRSSAPPGE